MSRFRPGHAAAALAVASAAVLAFACKSSPTSSNCNGNGGVAPSLVGSWSLVSITLGTNTFTYPTASGTLTFTATRYDASVNLPGPVTQVDSGTYKVVGSSCIAEYTEVAGNPQFSGSFTLADSVLSVSGTAGGQVVANVWHQVP